MRVRCTAVEYIPTGTLPGLIAADLTDADGDVWRLVEKSVMFDQYDSLEAADLSLPMDVTLRCEAIASTRPDAVTIRLADVMSEPDIYAVPPSSVVE